MASGLLFDHRGRLVATQGVNFGGRGVIRTDMASGRTALLAVRYAGRRFNAPNDLAIDAHGRLYFTDRRYTANEPREQDVMGVYRIDPDGALPRVAQEAGKPNGIAISPDQSTLYVASVETPLWCV